jgi:tetratricopeptide (TPR) repeat protein
MTSLKLAAGWVLLCLLCLGGAGCLPTERVSGGEEDDPDFQAGLSHKRAGRPERAVEAFERALQTNPRSVAAHFELGLLYYQGVTNYVAALYHLDRVQRLNPQFRYIQSVDQMVRGCKQEFIRDVPMGTITWQMEKDMQRLQRMEKENAELRQRVEQLRLELAARQASGQASGEMARLDRGAASGSSTITPLRQVTHVPLPGGSSSLRAGGGGRAYTVRKGDTLYSIARENGLQPNTLIAANPGIDPARIVPGQVLRLPPR